MARAMTIPAAALTPCSARPVMRTPMLGAVAQISDETT